MTSTLRDLRDLANLLSHMAGHIVDSRADGGDHGGMAGWDVGGTPVTTSAAQPKVRTSIYERWGTSRASQQSGRRTVAAWPRRRGSWRNSGELACAAAAYQVLSVGTGRSNGVLGRRWSYGGGAGVARRELASLMATAEAGRSSLLRLR